jgi:DNA-binding NtrC family response regulator
LLNGARILVCEDEPYIALDLAASVEDAGGEVVGPAASVIEAMALLNQGTVAGAILDVHLIGGDVTPVATILIEAGVPVVFQTGVGLPPGLKERYPDLAVWAKPTRAEYLIRHLAAQLHVTNELQGSNGP